MKKLVRVHYSRLPLLAAGLGGASAALPAHAQAVGGTGGGGLLQTIITWFMTNIAIGLVMVGVLGVGLMMLAGRAALGWVATVAVAALIIGNYQAITTALTSAFGG